MEHVYITGASGVIGSELAAAFTDGDGATGVSAVSRRPCPTLAADHPAQFQARAIFDGSWLAPDDTNATILHCAGLSDPRATVRNFATLVHEQIFPHVEMFEAPLARRLHGRLELFSSSGIVHDGALHLPICKDPPKAPISMNGLHKLFLELTLSKMAGDRGFELAIQRDAEFQIIGDGHAEPGHLEKADLFAAVRKVIAFKMREFVELFNICNAERTSLQDLITILTELTGYKLKATFCQAGSMFNPMCLTAVGRERCWVGRQKYHSRTGLRS